MVKNIIPITDALKTLWIGTCSIYEYREVTDPDTFQTTVEEIEIVVDEPCRLSNGTLETVDVDTNLPTLKKTITVFLRPDLNVKPGSIIIITQHGKQNKYISSSEASVYTNHQEIKLSIKKEV